MIFHAVNFTISYVFVWMYLQQIKKDPKRSLNYETGVKTSEIMGSREASSRMEESVVTGSQILSMVCMMGGLLAGGVWRAEVQMGRGQDFRHIPGSGFPDWSGELPGYERGFRPLYPRLLPG